MSKELNKKVVVAVGGGKGGVGKTLFASALARRLAERGKSVAAVDADFARPSIVASPNGKEAGISMSDFLTGYNIKLDSGTEDHMNVNVISGQDLYPDAAINGWRVDKFLRQVSKIKEQFIVLDLGPGTSSFTLDCFLNSDIGVLVTSPDPLAERDCFHFAQSCLMQGLRNRSNKDPEVKKLLRFLEKRNENSRVPLRQFLEKFNDGVHLVSSILEDLKAGLKTGIVVNMTNDIRDSVDGATLRTVFQDFLGLEVELWGQIGFDRDLRNKIRTKSEIPLQFTDDFDACVERLFSIISLYELSGNRDQKNDKNSNNRMKKIRVNGQNVDVICSTKCVLWNDCQHRRGGYACRIKAIGHLKSLEGERYLKSQREMVIIS